MGRVPRAAVVVAGLVAMLSGATFASDSARRPRDADALLQSALRHLEDSTFDARRTAIGELEQACKLAPERPDLPLLLGRACIDAGQLERGREALARAAKLRPDDAGVQLELGASWRWDWLSSLEDASYRHALECDLRAARLDSSRTEAWLAITALGIVSGKMTMAHAAAVRAYRSDPDGWEALLALGCASYWIGSLGRSDTAFRMALDRAPEGVRARFASVARLTSDGPHDVSVASKSGEPVWGSDPDLTTPENEVALNAQARLAHALLLFRDERESRWDQRTELFVRYGMPASITYNPPGATLEYAYKREREVFYAPPPLAYPFNMQVWIYPQLGLAIEMWDQSLHQSYKLPVRDDFDADPRPDPALLAAQPDLVALDGGRGVFRALAPGTTPMPARANLARFPSANGTRLLAHLVAPGAPADSLWGTWVVLDTQGHEVVRDSRWLSASACDPAAAKIVQFTAEVPPGEYRVDLSVASTHARRGRARFDTPVVDGGIGLAISDLVLLCGSDPTMQTGNAVRIEPSFDRRVAANQPLAVYFEIDRLATAADGSGRFSYTYVVRPVPEDERKSSKRAPVLEASREEQNIGPLRRQFVSVPIQKLKPGDYELDVQVRDLVGGGVALRTLRFTKEG